VVSSVVVAVCRILLQPDLKIVDEAALKLAVPLAAAPEVLLLLKILAVKFIEHRSYLTVTSVL
jgi:hypothetical protein